MTGLGKLVRICVCDYSGHPFQVQLSREFARLGHQVLHLHFAEFQTPKGRLTVDASDPPTLGIEAISIGRPFAKYGLVKRWLQEREVGHLFARRIDTFAPEVVLASNLPIDALSIVLRSSQKANRRFIFWQQDIYSSAIIKVLSNKLGFVGRLIGKYYEYLEMRVAQKSHRIVVIAESFRTTLKTKFKIAPDKIEVIENWAPLNEINVGSKANPWAAAHDLTGREVVLYTGTLGLKHNPAQLITLAETLNGKHDARVVVISEGPSADWLKTSAQQKSLSNLVVLPFQPYAQYPDVLASADVLVAMIENDSGEYSVPSKLLSYLSAGRPIVLSAPKENLASEIIERSGAGIAGSPGDTDAFVASVKRLLSDASARQDLGQKARAYADCTFDILRIGQRFEALLK